MRIPLFDYQQYRIVMESPFVFSGKEYLFFEEGVDYYHLYRSTRKINSFAELCYVAEKFVYLNPDFDVDKAKRLFAALSDRESGHIVRTYSDERVSKMVDRVFTQQKKPYCARMRKIIFNPSKPLSREYKMKVIGKLIGAKERPSVDEINDVVSELYMRRERITIKRVAEELQTTYYLVRWFFTEDAMQTIRSANKEIRQENQISKAIEIIDTLTDGGVPLKMRALKQMSSIRDYSLLKTAVQRYEHRD